MNRPRQGLTCVWAGPGPFVSIWGPQTMPVALGFCFQPRCDCFLRTCLKLVLTQLHFEACPLQQNLTIRLKSLLLRTGR